MTNPDPRWVIHYLRRAADAKTETLTVQADSMVSAIKRAQQQLHDAHPGIAIRITLCEPDLPAAQPFSMAHDVATELAS